MMRKILISAITVATAAGLANALCEGAGVLNTKVWFNGGDKQVNTGADGMYEYEVCEETSMVLWHDEDDRLEDQGGSSIWYPFDSTGYYGSFIAPMVAELGYLAVGYDLKDPLLTGQEAEYPYNFVKFGFNIKDGEKSPFDISGTDGLCVTYMADHSVTLEILAEISGEDPCSVSLTKADVPTTVDFTIEDFAQPKWAKEKIKCEEAFKAAQAIQFKVDGGAGDLAGVFRIFSIGPKGTCEPGDLAPEPSEFCYQSDGKGHASKQDTCFANTSKNALTYSSSSKTVDTTATSSSSEVAIDTTAASSSSETAIDTATTPSSSETVIDTTAASSSSEVAVDTTSKDTTSTKDTTAVDSSKSSSSSKKAEAKSSSSSKKTEAKSSSSSKKTEAKSSSSSKKTEAKSSSSKKDADFISDPGSVNGNFEITISGSKVLLQIPGSGFAKVTVMDMQGRIIKPSAMVKTGTVEISLAEINQGKYIVSVEQKSVRWVRSIAIK